MSLMQVRSSEGSAVRINQVSIECPFCHSLILPNYLFYHEDRLFAECPNSDCSECFVLEQNSFREYISVRQNSKPNKKCFSATIKEVSPDFDTIYNQAFFAEQEGLNQICGVGYRKSLEFLIKDYLISGLEDEDQKEIIRKKFLSNCIQEDIQDCHIKEIARRAVWLGNDETHYTRKWVEKDVSDLKQLIELTIRWIENEIQTKRLLEEMPEPIK